MPIDLTVAQRHANKLPPFLYATDGHGDLWLWDNTTPDAPKQLAPVEGLEDEAYAYAVSHFAALVKELSCLRASVDRFLSATDAIDRAAAR